MTNRYDVNLGFEIHITIHTILVALRWRENKVLKTLRLGDKIPFI